MMFNNGRNESYVDRNIGEGLTARSCTDAIFRGAEKKKNVYKRCNKQADQHLRGMMPCATSWLMGRLSMSFTFNAATEKGSRRS